MLLALQPDSEVSSTRITDARRACWHVRTKETKDRRGVTASTFRIRIGRPEVAKSITLCWVTSGRTLQRKSGIYLRVAIQGAKGGSMARMDQMNAHNTSDQSI